MRRRTGSRPIAILLAHLALLASHAACTSGSGSDPHRELREELEGRLTEAAGAGFSGSALVTVGGVTVLAQGYGLADRDGGVPNTPDTAFDFGSVMKDLTAAAVFKLQGEGELLVADSLATVLDDVPADKADITLLQLIQHRAGFATYHDTEGDFEPMTRLEARQRILSQKLRFEPGSEEYYSNAGYTLLADVVETVSGRAFTDYVHDELLVPAGMDESGFFGDAMWDEVETAIGYDASMYADNDPAGWPYTWALVGNGGLVATPSDIERWLVAVHGGDVLPTAELDAYLEDYLLPGSVEVDGKTVFSYAGGGDFGLAGLAVDCPEEETRLILATNTNKAPEFENLGEELGLLVLSAR
jgi:CubicO group peptidase (beta-lactamase class C family)